MKNKIKPGFYSEQQKEALALNDYYSWSKCARILESPLAFYRHYARKKVAEPTKAMDFGNLVHMAALEPGKFRDRLVVEPKFTGKTKDGKESAQSGEAKAKREAWHAKVRKDQVIVSEDDMEAIVEIVDNLMNHPQALELLSGGRAEGWGYVWDEHFERWMLIRPDFIVSRRVITVELKTTSKKILNPRAWAREAFFSGYHGQLAHNHRGVRMLHGLPDSHRDAVWIVVQSVAPFDVAVFPCGENLFLAGEDACHKAYNRLNKHLSLDPEMKNAKLWPGVQNHRSQTAEAEPWMLTNQEEDLHDLQTEEAQ